MTAVTTYDPYEYDWEPEVAERPPADAVMIREPGWYPRIRTPEQIRRVEANQQRVYVDYTLMRTRGGGHRNVGERDDVILGGLMHVNGDADDDDFDPRWYEEIELYAADDGPGNPDDGRHSWAKQSEYRSRDPLDFVLRRIAVQQYGLAVAEAWAEAPGVGAMAVAATQTSRWARQRPACRSVGPDGRRCRRIPHPDGDHSAGSGETYLRWTTAEEAGIDYTPEPEPEPKPKPAARPFFDGARRAGYRRVGVNHIAGPCERCGLTVRVDAGLITAPATPGGNWIVSHRTPEACVEAERIACEPVPVPYVTYTPNDVASLESYTEGIAALDAFPYDDADWIDWTEVGGEVIDP